MTAEQGQPKVVVVHRGARDSYEVSAALAQAGLLDRLVTDLYWPGDQAWTRSVPRYLQARGQKRFHPALPSKLVHQLPVTGSVSFALEQVSAAPHAMQLRAVRATDALLGRTAGLLARKHDSLLLSYSYYGYHAFRIYGPGGILFQLHPHPLSVRKILAQELADHPDCAASLNKEWELALPTRDFERLVAETRLPSHFLVASSFTRQTLIENGAAPDSIKVIPYGVDLQRFTPAPRRNANRDAPLRLLFVGTISQRKGIKYLVEALQLLDSRNIELTVCGRVVDGLRVLKPIELRVSVRPKISSPELIREYQSADLFVLPSVAEGFGHVLLEALASGLPILSTTHTAAPDLIINDHEGFAVEPRRPDLLAQKIDWAASHRLQLEEMRLAARRRAETFSWQRFGASVVDFMGRRSRR
jgi:glycosyltransferase involved in cell wall biosynthesis